MDFETYRKAGNLQQMDQFLVRPNHECSIVPARILEYACNEFDTELHQKFVPQTRQFVPGEFHENLAWAFDVLMQEFVAELSDEGFKAVVDHVLFLGTECRQKLFSGISIGVANTRLSHICRLGLTFDSLSAKIEECRRRSVT